MVFNDTLLKIDVSAFFAADWKEVYYDAIEIKPPNTPEPRGKAANMYCLCNNADYARFSHAGIMIILIIGTNHLVLQELMGVPIDGLCSMFCDSKSAIKILLSQNQLLEENIKLLHNTRCKRW
jgi:hypothetical protein